MTVPGEDIERLVQAEHWDPFAILGPHPAGERSDETVVRAFVPEAADVSLLPDGAGARAVPMKLVHAAGLYEAALPSGASSRYKLRVADRKSVV